jgi:hypothetical protein
MISFGRYSQKKPIGILLFLIAVSVLSGRILLSHAQSETETVSTTASPGESVEKLLKEADAYFERQEFAAGYDLYLRVLGLDPSNLHARERIYNIINTYKTLIDRAQKEGNNDQATLFSQKYRNSIRDLLQILTTQLKRRIQRYGELVEAQKNGEDVKENIIPALSHVIQILQDLKTIYEEFSQENAEAEKIVERLSQSINKYEQELSFYQE